MSQPLSKPLSMQEVISRLHEFWAAQGCTIWQPYSEKVGAGTMNPATVLRVLGPEPWNVAYVEPSFRPDDGRFAENPNRMQMHHQYQVILKPDPGNPQELYLASLEAIGLDRTRHDIRFVEDNWESPALGAWGLGWEVWLDGQEITQFTYFQQSGSLTLDPVSVEITYGLDRIVMYLQHKTQVWDIDVDGVHTFARALQGPRGRALRLRLRAGRRRAAAADVRPLQGRGRRLHPAWAGHPGARLCAAPEPHLQPARRTRRHRRDRAGQVLCRHARPGKSSFRALRPAARAAGVPLAEERARRRPGTGARPPRRRAPRPSPATQAFLLELGSEELPPQDVVDGIAQIEEKMAALLAQYKLELRLAARDRHDAPPGRLCDRPRANAGRRNRGEARPGAGPGLRHAGPADQGAGRLCPRPGRGRGQTSKRATTTSTPSSAWPGTPRRACCPACASSCSTVCAGARPCAGTAAASATRGRCAGSWRSTATRSCPSLGRASPAAAAAAARASPMPRPGCRRAASRPSLSPTPRRTLTPWRPRASSSTAANAASRWRSWSRRQRPRSAATTTDEPALLDEVTDLVEAPQALLGTFEAHYLDLPAPVLIGVMKKHQRYFPVVKNGKLVNHFVTVANSNELAHPEVVREGNEGVIRARYADAAYFYRQDTGAHARELHAAARHADLPCQAGLDAGPGRTAQAAGARRCRDARRHAGRGGGHHAGRRVEQVGPGHQHGGRDDEPAGHHRRNLRRQGRRDAGSGAGDPRAVPAALRGRRRAASRPGLALSLADKLDSLVGLFAVGAIPTGSADPFGLRRAALGIVNSLMATKTDFSVRAGWRRRPSCSRCR